MPRPPTTRCAAGAHRLHGAVQHVGAAGASINCGYSAEGLPIGLQIAGRRFDDLGVLRFSRAFEQIRDAQSPGPNPSNDIAAHPHGAVRKETDSMSNDA
jgi:hypothetical protein